MSEIWDKPITDTTDWGGDSSTGGLPVSGRQVQAWLKSRIAKILTEAQITKIIEDWVQENGFADDEGFVTLSSDQEINGLKNFLQGLMVNGGLVTYDPELKVWQLTGNLLVSGGISMYSNLEGFKPSTIMDGILTDEVTITVKDGRLTVLAAESGLNYDELDAYLKKYEYTTISEVDARISELVNGAPQAYDTLKEIADVLEGNVNSIGDILATLAEKANTTYVDEAIADTKTWVEEQQYINEIDPSYIEAALGYQPYDGDTNSKEFTTKTYVKDNFVSRTLANEIEAIHNFLNGFTISGIPFRKTANGQLFIDASVVFSGGVTMYGTDTTPAPSIFDGLPIDNETIYWDGDVLKAMGGGGGGGVADSVAWANVYGKPTWITNTKPTYNYSEILNTPDLSVYALASSLANYALKTSIPTNNNQLTNGAGYITSSALNGFATETFVNTAVNGAKEWVEEQQYLTEITSGMIESVLGYQPYDGDTNRLGFLTSSALNGYATQSWVNTALAGYLPKNGTAASATKLATPRTIWGRSFDGTGNVSGRLDDVEFINFVGSWLQIGLERNESSAVQNIKIQTHGGKELLINPTGQNVAIGGTTASAKLHVYGNLLTTGGITMYSQRSLKNILSYEGLSLEQLSVIKPIKFTWKDGRDNRYHVGGVADDMATVVPEVVYSTNDFLTMDYGNAGFYVAASLIKPVIYCYNKVEKHEKDIDYLKRENVAIKNENKALREEINQLKQAS